MRSFSEDDSRAMTWHGMTWHSVPRDVPRDPTTGGGRGTDGPYKGDRAGMPRPPDPVRGTWNGKECKGNPKENLD